jgi:glycosyltransferase involved in cell wall biosynthesis
MPTVSVVVPNYNHARFLRRRIDTILAQTFQDFELILLDDCSTDDSRSILREYAVDPRVRFEFNDVNSGSTFKQWNKGVRLAQGKYFWIAESDDYADDRLLERLVAVLNDQPTVTFAYCQSWLVLNNHRLVGFADFYLDYLDPHRWKADFCVDGREECRNFLVFSNIVPNASAVVFRRAAYEGAGGADESLRLAGDWKLWAAMALAGRIAYLSEPLNYFQSHETTVRKKSHDVALDVVEDVRVIRWILNQVRPADAVLERVCYRQVDFWVPAILSLSVSCPSKLSILKDISAIDPHPIRRAARPAIRTMEDKLSRRWRSIRSILTVEKM